MWQFEAQRKLPISPEKSKLACVHQASNLKALLRWNQVSYTFLLYITAISAKWITFPGRCKSPALYMKSLSVRSRPVPIDVRPSTRVSIRSSEALQKSQSSSWQPVHGERLFTTRTKRVAAKSNAAMPAQSIPFIGVAMIIADTGFRRWRW
jgi:hypothetical protein